MVVLDEFGPEKILEVYNPKHEMHGFLTIDSLALGPAKGGIRMTSTITGEEVARLARAMTWKNAMADLPFGGGKAGIVANDKQISKQKKRDLVEAFATAIKPLSPSLYIAGPDMNMAEEEMGWIAKKNGKDSVTGKPKRMGGLPHELGSTGFGVYHATAVAARFLQLQLSQATIAVEGFGNVGWFVCKYLSEIGTKIVAVSDSQGCAYRKEGLDFQLLDNVKLESGSVTNYPGAGKRSCVDIISVDVDILITAAIPDLIKAGQVNNVSAKLIVEGSNIPMTPEVESLFHRRGILVVPDFVANAGGVISSYVEHRGGSEKHMFGIVEEKIKKNMKAVLDSSKRRKITPREAALQIAQERVRMKCDVCKI